jgi:multidrug efflux system membrane fusion protein
VSRILRNGIVAVAVAVAVILAVLYLQNAQRYPGTDDAYVDADVVAIAPQVMGPIVNVAIEDNQAIRAGDLLFEIDPRPFQIAVDAARAELDQTGQNVRALADTVSAAEGEVQFAKAHLRLMEVQYRRVAAVAAVGAVSLEERDRAAAARDEARATLATAQSELRGIRDALGDTGTVNPERRAAFAKLQSAELQLSFTQVTAPVNGYVTNLELSVGSFAVPGSPMLSLVDTDSWRVVAYMKENQLRGIRAGQATRIYLPAYAGVRFQGRVQGIGWGIEAQDGTSDEGGLPSVSPTVDWVRMAQRFPVRITLVGLDSVHPLRKGMRATVRIDASADPRSTGGGS